ncbi:MAG TPA: sensor domain-containing diguanylate cyclase [Terriglobales bacterium]|jgi:diguanylate cyclase (GGDEF)-like protein|nr:sensor domain-containing diguanylate cyclase [Terriglobales bacterium]
MQKIAILYDASQAVLSTFDLDEVLQRILVIARDYFHLQNVAILLVDKDKDPNYLCARSQIGGDPGFDGLRVAIGTGMIGTAAKLKRPLYVPDFTQDARFAPSGKKTRSELAIPLMVRDEVVGVLDCQSENPDHFDSQTVDLLTLFSTQASMALQNARLYSLERRRASQLEAINAIARETTVVLDIKNLLGKASEKIQKAFQVSHVSMLLRDDDHLVLRAHHGELTPRIPEGGRVPADSGLLGRALFENKTLIENDIQAAVDYVAMYLETGSRMCIPLISFGQALGVLVLDSARTGSFSTSDVQSLESVADICATAIQNAHYVERVKQLAYLDGLTGIFNRRFFELRIEEEVERSRRFDAGMAVIMVDIDQFKRLNDEFGHLLGDEVLRQVSSIFSQQLRKIDVVCRYGGEEFAILLSQTNQQHAMGVAEKLRRLIENWQFPGVPRPVTISAGVATCPDHGCTRDHLVKAADAGLYAAKQAGRNCVRVISAAPNVGASVPLVQQ